MSLEISSLRIELANANFVAIIGSGVVSSAILKVP
jgi:hypothetical protein